MNSKVTLISRFSILSAVALSGSMILVGCGSEDSPETNSQGQPIDWEVDEGSESIKTNLTREMETTGPDGEVVDMSEAAADGSSSGDGGFGLRGFNLMSIKIGDAIPGRYKSTTVEINGRSFFLEGTCQVAFEAGMFADFVDQDNTDIAWNKIRMFHNDTEVSLGTFVPADGRFCTDLDVELTPLDTGAAENQNNAGNAAPNGSFSDLQDAIEELAIVVRSDLAVKKEFVDLDRLSAGTSESDLTYDADLSADADGNAKLAMAPLLTDAPVPDNQVVVMLGYTVYGDNVVDEFPVDTSTAGISEKGKGIARVFHLPLQWKFSD